MMQGGYLTCNYNNPSNSLNRRLLEAVLLIEWWIGKICQDLESGVAKFKHLELVTLD